ncbi:phosphatase PAP2 family protein [Salinithrix halophila]|uniref:Phosphatase PAP2 family protein n=1 Tax=Salinithrix halophila TaxID=1485204 RepID=A0ABV8JDQ0_9BACL
MKRLVTRLRNVDDRWICHINQQWKCRTMDWLMPRFTHIGGAGFTLSFLLGWLVLMTSPLRYWAVEGLIALSGSHLAVRLCKSFWQRVRPYLHLHGLNTFPDPLTDYSFPSGHTTAAFSVAVVFVLHAPWTAWIAIPAAGVVGLSRMYLGLHYPTDVVVGAWLGSVFAVGSHYGLGML